MKQVVIFATLFALCYGLEYDDLRVKFNTSGVLEDQEYFFRIPRTTLSAVLSGWRLTTRPHGPHPVLRMYCPSGRYVCALYTLLGNIAGLQVALPVDKYVSPVDPAPRFVRWHAPGSLSESARDFWTVTQFYVSEESLKREAIEGRLSTIDEAGVWVTDRTGKLTQIPIAEADVAKTDFTVQACVPGMGMHYYYNMSSTMLCEDMFPWFALTHNQQLVGTGFQMFGSYAAPAGERDWFERPPPFGALLAIPNRPECLYEWATNYGVVSLHIYYVPEPWNIPCTAA